MRVRFSLHHDGLDAVPENTAVGLAAVGPEGFLRLLESDLGIPRPAVHPAEELTLYRACLDECNDLARFYHRSFEVDPVGVANTLLDWRRQWHLHGWDGTFPDGVSRRLADLAAVETQASERAPPTMGQRLRRILALLDSRRVQIRTLELLDQPDDMPRLWRRLIEHFHCETAAEPTGLAPPESDLGKTQAFLQGGPAHLLQGDGSLLVLRAVSRDLTAQATAELLRRCDDVSQVVAIATRDGIILDNALQRAGLPRVGFQHYSPFRAASQVLKLALALVWEPLAPHRLLQFLIHPVSPLAWNERTQLAQAVAAAPGIGGPAWRSVLANIGDSAGDMEFWTTPERYSASEGAPIEALSLRARRCAAWLGRRIAIAGDAEEQAVYGAAHAQAEALAATLDRRRNDGAERMAKIEVDRLVHEATRPLPDETTFAEAGHVPGTTFPGNVAAPVDEVFWWDLAPTPIDLASVWSASERNELAAVGVELPSVPQRIKAERRAWLRPVLNCRRRLTLVVHDQDEGRHPLWARLEEQLSGWLEVSLDAGLLQGRANLADALGIPAPPLPKQSLPAPKRWWRIRRSLPPPDTESYTSLRRLCYHPHQWMLAYHAALQGSRIAGVADGNLLRGNLAHRLFERFFAEHEEHQKWRSLDEGRIRAWLDGTIDDLIEKEGAVLLETGRGVERQQVATTLRRSLFQLLRHMREAGVVKVQSEQPIEKAFPGGMLHGNADFVLVGENGRRAVLDAKWSGERYRREELEEGRHLQLAAYSFALAENDWPSPAYYIVSTGNVLAPNAAFFPRALATGTAVNDAESIWRKLLVTRDWRLAQLARGEIEVNAGAEPDDDSEPPEDGLDTRIEADRFDDFRWLVGVEPSR